MEYHTTIWKFPLPVEVDEYVEMELPKDACVLTAQIQDGRPTLWAMVNPDPRCPVETRRFKWVATGEPNVDFYNLHYIATVQNAGFVYHLFRVVTMLDRPSA